MSWFLVGLHFFPYNSNTRIGINWKIKHAEICMRYRAIHTVNALIDSNQHNELGTKMANFERSTVLMYNIWKKLVGSMFYLNIRSFFSSFIFCIKVGYADFRFLFLLPSTNTGVIIADCYQLAHSRCIQRYTGITWHSVHWFSYRFSFHIRQTCWLPFFCLLPYIYRGQNCQFLQISTFKMERFTEITWLSAHWKLWNSWCASANRKSFQGSETGKDRGKTRVYLWEETMPSKNNCDHLGNISFWRQDKYNEKLLP